VKKRENKWSKEVEKIECGRKARKHKMVLTVIK
jgi:hypothetical protein